MLTLKTVPVSSKKGIFQTTMRDIDVVLDSVFEHNVIEYFSESLASLEAALETKIGKYPNEEEILEIGLKPLFKKSVFISSTVLSTTEENLTKQLKEISESDVQLIVVQTDTILNKSVLSDIAYCANGLRVIVFLTVGNEAKVLSSLNLVQIKSDPIVNLIDYREYFEKNKNIIGEIYNTMLFNIMS